MIKAELVASLNAFVREEISPRPEDRNFVSSVYGSIQQVLGRDSCLQIGSYARFTTIRPLHDLDILWLLGGWPGHTPDPSHALEVLEQRISSQFINPTRFKLAVSRQSHSLCIAFMSGDEEFFAVDIVPAYSIGQNEFGDDTYMVPEIAEQPRAHVRKIYEDIRFNDRAMQWIPSDPRGYTSIATHLNRSNPDFRKAVKFVKAWKVSCAAQSEDFKMKSFHIEQAIARAALHDTSLDSFDLVFGFLIDLERFIQCAQFPDRADQNKYIDQYVNELSPDQCNIILANRDGILKRFEDIEAEFDGWEVLSSGPHYRSSRAEEFLFDSRIPTFSEGRFRVIGQVAYDKENHKPAKILDPQGTIQAKRKIRFQVGKDAPGADVFKWKVQNDRSSPQPRGEITDHNTLNTLETTEYPGNHYVECYAIRDGVCVARGRQKVTIS